MSEELKIITYKGFDHNLKCRGFQFEIGATYKHVGKVKKCNSGFHSCEYPLHIFNYYDPPQTRFAIVEVSGAIDREKDGDTKIACENLHIKKEIFLPDIVIAVIKWVTDLCDPVKSNHSTGNHSASSATGNQSASSATGYQSASSSTGNLSASSATGDRSASSATGDQSASSATGKNAVAMSIGICGKAMAGIDGAIVLCNHNDDGDIRHIRASKVGENGIKPDVWYALNDSDEFIEVDE